MRKLLLFGIMMVAFAARFYMLDSYPALNADEAAIGYNAFSLLETGKDEHGNSWPIHFQSFNDYKPGLYVYVVLPFVKVLGLNEWAVRIPGALMGVLTVFVIYLLAKEIVKPDKSRFDDKYPLIAALLLAINPWHIHFSRGGWEVNAATLFITAGLLFLLKSFKNKKFFVPSAIFIVISLYTYHAARVVVPPLVFGVVLLNLKSIKQNIRVVLIASVFGLVLLLPLAKDLTNGALISRAAGVGLFADTGPLSRINEQRGEHSLFQGIEAKVFHNKPVNYSLAFLQNWGEHYWGEFLFLSGDEIQRNRVPETGQFYLIELVFVLVGIFTILRKPQSWYPVLIWLVLAPIAAALTFQSPHALRAHNMVIPLTLISAFGLFTIIQNSKRIVYLVFVAILLWSFVRYEHMYWTHMSKEYPFSSQYGVKELVEYIKNNSQNNDRVIVTDRYDQPYILFLFYLNYPPDKFQNNHTLSSRDQFGFSTVGEFDKYVFKQIDFEEDRVQYPNSLIIGTNEQIPSEANIVKKIYGSNGHLYFKVVRN